VARLNNNLEVVLKRAPHGENLGSSFSNPELCGDIVNYTRTDHISVRGDYGGISRDEVHHFSFNLDGTELTAEENDRRMAEIVASPVRRSIYSAEEKRTSDEARRISDERAIPPPTTKRSFSW